MAIADLLLGLVTALGAITGLVNSAVDLTNRSKKAMQKLRASFRKDTSVVVTDFESLKNHIHILEAGHFCVYTKGEQGVFMPYSCSTSQF